MKRLRTESPPLILPYMAHEALSKLGPRHWVRPDVGHSVLCWGKAALATAQVWGAVKNPSLGLGISPEAGPAPAGWNWIRGEHPLPGPGSRAAGQAILEFFDTLRRFEARNLDVFLSGGASSLAWIARGSQDGLADLYAMPWTIARLNTERAKFCALKAGGAARWLKILAPAVRARVYVVSDVLPFGPEIVGSGPFWDGEILHSVEADNAKWVSLLARAVRESGENLIEHSSGNLGDWRQWVNRLSERALQVRVSRRHGILIFGGEPQVDLRMRSPPGRGGRQTQIAAGLLRRLGPQIAAGQIEILCMSSDGVDGKSGAAGAWLTQRVARTVTIRELDQALARMDSGTFLSRAGALVPSRPTGTNVQDVVIVRVLG